MEYYGKIGKGCQLKYEGGFIMKGNYEQMTCWVEELKNPIGNLMGQLELHQEEIDLDFYHRLWENCRDLNEDVNRLVQLIRMRAGDVLPHWESVWLPERLERALQAKEELGRRKGIFFRSEYLQADHRIWTDGGMIQELMEQLLHHVIRYAEKGNTIRLGAQVRSELATLWVENEGQGFALMPRRLYTSEARRRGRSLYTGLGSRLELCRGLAQLLGGELSEEYARRGGIRVELHLPALCP